MGHPADPWVDDRGSAEPARAGTAEAPEERQERHEQLLSFIHGFYLDDQSSLVNDKDVDRLIAVTEPAPGDNYYFACEAAEMLGRLAAAGRLAHHSKAKAARRLSELVQIPCTPEAETSYDGTARRRSVAIALGQMGREGRIALPVLFRLLDDEALSPTGAPLAEICQAIVSLLRADRSLLEAVLVRLDEDAR